ncbi:hypothetical protein [Sphingomonas psychrotolerans]|uniref:Uncharacterized protein n=1 Tax=Sphingomonas psychrotolerans TaxID=1327635 RepID=A0A2K8MLW6_9SPHN|nr:hypothetical protein [Sphingomonas psychrotolerans]ATY33576.1 hypothetical protein CVN68_17745 [Sphingomonas psychrotolerans]
MRPASLALALVSASPVHAQAGGDEAGALQAAIERGRLLYSYDQAAWHGTDDMLGKIKKPQERLGGWIVDGPPESAELVFYDQNTADPHAVYVATFNGSKLLSSRVLGPGEDRSLTPQRKRMIAAVRTATAALEASQVKRCVEKPFNTVVLPPASANDPVSVYYLTPQIDTKVIPFGGHYRVDVSADNKAGPVRAFTKSCIAFPIEPPGKSKNAKSTILTITHLLDPTPTEIHVFSSLVAGRLVMVITAAERIWSVDGDRGIRPFDLRAR